MSLFKEGDVVVLRPRRKGWDKISPHYTDEMVEECECGIAFEVLDSSYLDGTITISSNTYFWSVLPEWIEHHNVSMENE